MCSCPARSWIAYPNKPDQVRPGESTRMHGPPGSRMAVFILPDPAGRFIGEFAGRPVYVLLCVADLLGRPLRTMEEALAG
jgi:hypothetical protein